MRIELSRDGWKTVERTWDTRESRRGWTIVAGNGPGKKGARLVCPWSLAEGGWEWRATVFVHGDEKTAPRAGAFRIDATPPAEVTGLRVRRSPEGAVQLSWEPVSLDVEGRPEDVDHYVVYRYDARGIFARPEAVRLGTTRLPAFVDRSVAGAPTRDGRTSAGTPSRGRALYYEVVAVDVAGNELGLRDAPPGSGMGPAAIPPD